MGFGKSQPNVYCKIVYKIGTARPVHCCNLTLLQCKRPVDEKINTTFLCNTPFQGHFKNKNKYCPSQKMKQWLGQEYFCAQWNKEPCFLFLTVLSPSRQLSALNIKGPQQRWPCNLLLLKRSVWGRLQPSFSVVMTSVHLNNFFCASNVKSLYLKTIIVNLSSIPYKTNLKKDENKKDQSRKILSNLSPNLYLEIYHVIYWFHNNGFIVIGEG